MSSRIPSILRNGVVMGFLVSGAVTIWTLIALHGWSYYTTPLGVRAYSEPHRLLRPSGPVGQTFGVIGAAMMLVPFIYMLRKRMRRGSSGSLRGWLEVHLFCGVAGPVLVTLHTSFKFNGIISAAYWSMVIVMLSGFAGRHLYLRIPRNMRGVELTRAELDAQAETLRQDLGGRAGGSRLLEKIEGLCTQERERKPTWRGLLFGEFTLRRTLARFAREASLFGLPAAERDAVVRLTTERVLLLRRASYLQRTKSAFALWHVFHLPLVYILLVIVTLHVSVATYLGYVPFRW